MTVFIRLFSYSNDNGDDVVDDDDDDDFLHS